MLLSGQKLMQKLQCEIGKAQDLEEIFFVEEIIDDTSPGWREARGLIVGK